MTCLSLTVLFTYHNRRIEYVQALLDRYRNVKRPTTIGLLVQSTILSEVILENIYIYTSRLGAAQWTLGFVFTVYLAKIRRTYACV
jgi:hypothetical protein